MPSPGPRLDSDGSSYSHDGSSDCLGAMLRLLGSFSRERPGNNPIGDESLQRFKRRAYFFIRCTPLVIGFDLGPSYLALLIDYINRWMWDAVNLLTFVGGIAQAVRIDNLVFRIRENREIDRSFTVGCNFLSKALAHVRWVDADREQLYV